MALPKSRIEHVIFYMLENRSFDNVLGWLYDSGKPPDHLNVISNAAQKDVAFLGLEENKYYNQFPGDVEKQFVKRGVGRSDNPLPDPNEQFENINVQLFYPEWGAPWSASPPVDQNPSMMGFLADYKTAKEHVEFGSAVSKEQALQIMQTYDSSELNILNTLAENFAVSDYWFSSVPTQTNCNRAFSITGQSDGFVNNEGFLFGIVPDKFGGYTIWDALCDNGFAEPSDWMIYYQDLLPAKNEVTGKIELKGFSYTQDAFNIPNPEAPGQPNSRNVAHIDELFKVLDGSPGAGPLSAFTYIEPMWVGMFEVAGIVKDTNLPNSYHPPGDLAPGEAFVKRLYEALRNNRDYWEKTLLIITFDEHGGTYDHVPPPAFAAPPGLSGKPPLPGGEFGFGFDRFGVRVPTLMISPWIEKNTVFRSLTDDPGNKPRTPYDHTSLIKSILNWERFGIEVDEAKFGARVAHAPGFDSVLNVQGDNPRSDTPESLPEPFFKVDEKRARYFSDLQAWLLPLLVAIINGVSHLEAKEKAKEILQQAESLTDIHNALARLAKDKTD